MGTDSALLPSAFSDLEPYAQAWCLPTENQRFAKRMSSSMDEMESFYNAAFPRLEEAKAYLDELDVHDLPGDAENLMHMMFSLIIVSFPIELWRQPAVPDAGAAEIVCWLEAPL